MRREHGMIFEEQHSLASASDPFGKERRRLDEESGITEATVALTHMAKAGAYLRNLGLSEAYDLLTKAARSVNKAYGR